MMETTVLAILRDFDRLLSLPSAAVEVDGLIASIDELAKRASKAPWMRLDADTRDDRGKYYTSEIVAPDAKTIVEFSNSGVAEIREEDETRWDEQGQRDAAFIVTLVNAWPQLRALAAENARLWQEEAHFADDCLHLRSERETLKAELSRMRGKVEEAWKIIDGLTHGDAELVYHAAIAFLATLQAPEDRKQDGEKP